MCVPYRVCQDASCNERNIANALERTHLCEIGSISVPKSFVFAKASVVRYFGATIISFSKVLSIQNSNHDF